MIDIAKCLEKIRPEQQWSLNGNDYNELVWMDNTNKPELDEIESAWKLVCINELKQSKQSIIQSALTFTDYKAIKYAEGEMTEEEYYLVKKYRAALRESYNLINNATTTEDINKISIPVMEG